MSSNRRDFIKGTAWMGAAAVAAGCMSNDLKIAGLGGSMQGYAAPALKKIRVGVVGLGMRGPGAVHRLAAIPGVEVAAVCDVDARAREAAAAKIAEMTGVRPKAVTDFRKALEDPTVDGLICAAPDHWHAWAAVAAMKAGKAIYVEKPCTCTAAECAVLRRVQRETGTVFEMGSQRRSAKVTLDAMKEIHAGVIGDIHFARTWYQNARAPLANGNAVPVPEWLDWNLWQGPMPRTDFKDNIVHYKWHWHRRWGTGECPNNATHFVDLARWAMKLDYPERVISSGGNSGQCRCI
jgi:predicted dehydrogenase